MRRDLVEEILTGASEDLFEDVLYTHVPAAAVIVTRSIFSIAPVDTRFEVLGQQMRTGTHVARAVKAKFPYLARGDIIRDGTAPDFADGTSYAVLDFQAPTDGDGRVEIDISLVVA